MLGHSQHNRTRFFTLSVCSWLELDEQQDLGQACQIPGCREVFKAKAPECRGRNSYHHWRLVLTPSVASCEYMGMLETTGINQ